MIVEELGRLVSWGERHRRLIARLLIALGLTALVDIVGAILIWALERHAKGTDIHGIGDAFFFSTVQLLTVSSQLQNPVTAAGKVLDVALEIWALFVVSAVAGSFAAFFGSAD
jgi:drug/metabolite transporter superfamily protein YnfA